MANPSIRAITSSANYGQVVVPAPAVAAGDLLLAYCLVASTGHQVNASGTVWTPLSVTSWNSQDYLTEIVLTRIATGSEPASYVFQEPSGSIAYSVVVVSVRDVPSAGALVAAGVFAHPPGGSPTPATAPSINVAAGLLLCFYGFDAALSSWSVTPASGQTPRLKASSYPGIYVADETWGGGVTGNRTALASYSSDASYGTTGGVQVGIQGPPRGGPRMIV